MRIALKTFWPALVWLILSTIAFCVPGEVLPKDDWLGKLHADKWIHVGIFTVMVILWCFPVLNNGRFQASVGKVCLIVAGVFLGYGIVMEFVQHFFVPNRSFDLGDIAADAVGCILGFIFTRSQWKV